MNLDQIQDKISQAKGKQQFIKDRIKKTNEEIKTLSSEIRASEKAQTIIQLIAKQTQEQLEYKLSELVTLAIHSIFDDPYDFEIRFVIRRGKTECDIVLVKNGKTFIPKEEEVGGGVIDVCSFAIRVTMWALKKPRTMDMLFFDEPFKHLRGKEENERMVKMVKRISEELNLQIIMIGDEKIPFKEIENGADKIFDFKLVKGKTEISDV